MRLAIVLGILVVAGAAWWALQPRPPATAPRAQAPVTATPAPRVARPAPPPRLDAGLAPPRSPVTLLPEQGRPDMTVEEVAASQKLLERQMAEVAAAAILDKVAQQAPDTKAPAMSADAVKDAIGQAKPGIVACYAQALEKNAEVAGRLVVRFTIHAANGVGRLRDAEIVEDDPGNPFLGMCALGAIAKVEFEAAADGIVTVTYPFKFEPGAKEATP